MHEVRAYKNEDGTFRVQVLGMVEVTRKIGEHEVKELREREAEVPRAALQIISFPQSTPLKYTAISFTVEE